MKNIKLAAAVVFAIGLVARTASGQIQLEPLAYLHGTNGAEIWASLVQGRDGAFYGTTQYGGTDPNRTRQGPPGYGAVFKVTTDGLLTSLASFHLTNGSHPRAPLIQAADGAFYGTTHDGGDTATQGPFTDLVGPGCGTVFRVTVDGVLTTLVSFSGTNGINPAAGLVQGPDGSLYGTTRFGGASFGDPHSTYQGYGDGTVFKLTTNGALTVVYSFPAGGGDNPMAPLVVGRDLKLYGCTFGGANGVGMLFRMTPGGELTVLASIRADIGIAPYSGCIEASDGWFYFVSSSSLMPGGLGGVFRVSTNGAQERLIQFGAAEGASHGALVQASDGNFYGVRGGTSPASEGSIFQLTLAGVYTTLASFSLTNGADPRSALVQGLDGNLYGGTGRGGPNDPVYGLSGTTFRLHVPGADSPNLRSIAKSGDSVSLSFGAIAGRQYQVQFRNESASSTAWQDLGQPLTATNSLATAVDTNASDAARFYRVGLLP